MDKYRILNRDLYKNFINDNYADEVIVSNKLKKSSPKTLMRRLIENNEKSDIKVKIGKWTFNCHLSVLQCYATYFRKDCFRAERLAELPTEQVSPTTFAKIYEWMTVDEPKVQREEIVELFISAYYLGIKALIKQIWTCLSNVEHINENEAYLLYYEAALAHVKCIKELMLKRVSKFFLILVAFREFVFMSVDDLCCLMNSDAIGVNTEIEIFMACLRWLTYKWSERKKFLLKIMRTVRFGLIPPGFLIELDRDMIEHPVIKSVMRKPKLKQLVIDGLKLATTQFCYGSSNSIQPRQWLYDEKCDYHLKVNQLIDYKITYDKFHEYLYFLQKCNKDHWRAFVYIKSENQKCSKPLDFAHLQLLQETSQTPITQSVEEPHGPPLSLNFAGKKAANTQKLCTMSKNHPIDASINSIMSYQEWTVYENQRKDEVIDKRRELAKLKSLTLIDRRRFENQSTESSSSESISPKQNKTKLKRYIKRRPKRKKKANVKETMNVVEGRCPHKAVVSYKEIDEEDLSLDIHSDEHIETSTNDELSGDGKSNVRANKPLKNSLPICFTSSSTGGETYFDLETATVSKATNVKVKQTKKQNKTELLKCKGEVISKKPNLHENIKHLKCVCETEAKGEPGLAKTISLLKKSKIKRSNYGAAEERKTEATTQFKSLFKNKTLLILGGTDPYSQMCGQADSKQSQTFIDKVLLYNDKFRQWVQLPHTAFGTRHHHAAVVCRGLVYIIGGTKVLPGCKKAFFETSIWCFNPKTKIWNFATNLPQNRRDFAAFAIEGKNNEAGFLVIGGETFDRVALNSVWLYKVNEKVWEHKASLNIGRYGFAATIVAGKEIWIGGGIAFSSITATKNPDDDKRIRPFTNFITDTIEYFSLEKVFDKNFKGKWIRLPYRLPRPCLYGKFCATTNNEIFLIGGFGAANFTKTLDSFDAIYRFDISCKHWLKCGTLKYARHGHEVILIDDCIIIIGGVSSHLNCALKSIEMFSIKTNETMKLIPDLPWSNSGLAAVIVRGEY